MYQLSYHPEVAHDVASLGTTEKRRIQKSIEDKLLISPVQFGKPLQHSLSGLRSFRVGDYRVIFKLIETEIFLVLIAHRSVVNKATTKRF